MSAIATVCAQCGAALNAPDTFIGKKVKCKQCGHEFVFTPTAGAVLEAVTTSTKSLSFPQLLMIYAMVIAAAMTLTMSWMPHNVIGAWRFNIVGFVFFVTAVAMVVLQVIRPQWQLRIAGLGHVGTLALMMHASTNEAGPTWTACLSCVIVGTIASLYMHGKEHPCACPKAK